jgi:hypothetical protein
VTHEQVRPYQHEQVEEHIYRDIHVHNVYHQIQPVRDVQVLPPRHFVLDAHGNKVEIPDPGGSTDSGLRPPKISDRITDDGS